MKKWKRAPIYFLSNKLFGQPLEPSLLPSFREKILPMTQNQVGLDLGCGNGYYLSYFSKNSIGIDIDRKCIKNCRKINLSAIGANLNNNPKKLPLKNSFFDFIFLSHILEHLKSPNEILVQSKEWLKPKGRVFVGLPTYYNVLRLLGDDYFQHHPGHIHIFKLEVAKKIIKQSGYSIEKVFWDPVLIRFQSKSWYKIFYSIFQKLPPWIKSYFSLGFWIIAKSD